MLDENWRQLTNNYIRGQLARDEKLLKITKILPSKDSIPTPSEFFSLFRKLWAIIEDSRG